MTKQFVIYTVFFLCSVAGVSVAHAQNLKYTGGNGISLSEYCNLEPPLEKNDYTDDRDVKAAEYCALHIVSKLEIAQQPCSSVTTDGIVSVTLERGNGKFYFWWPSSGKDVGTYTTWYSVNDPGTTTFNIPGFKESDDELRVYSEKESLPESLPLTGMWTVLQPFAPGTITAGYNVPVCAGDANPEIGSAATPTGGDGMYTYQWHISTDNGGTFTPISGATSTVHKPTETNPGTYIYKRLDADGRCNIPGTYADGEATLVRYQPFTAGTISSTGQTVCLKESLNTITSETDASGGNTDITYEWRYTGTLSGTVNDNSATLTPPATIAETPGTYRFTRWAQDSKCSATMTVSSGTWEITVNPLPEATVEGVAVCYNTSATLTATLGAGTTTSMTYTWNIGGVSSTTTANSMATGALPVTTTYTVQLTNSNGCTGAVSAAASITVHTEFTQSDPESTVICYNTSTTLNLADASGGTSTITYKWEKYDGQGWTTADDTYNEADYTTPLLTETTYFRRVAYNTCGTITTNSATVTVYPNFTAGTLATYDNGICVGGANPEIGSAATPTGGNGMYTYQWYISTDNGGTFTEISSATLTTYTPVETQPGTYLYKRLDADGRCNTAGTYAAGEAKLVIYQPFTAGTLTVYNEVICAGDAIPEIGSDATPTGGSGSYTYKWERSENSGAFTEISGATLTAYTPDDAAPGTYLFRRLDFDTQCNPNGTHAAGTATVVRLATLAPGTITGATYTETCINVLPPAIIMTEAVGGSGSYTYQWYKNNIKIEDATNVNYTFTAGDVVTPEGATYTRKVTDTYCASSPEYAEPPFFLLVKPAEIVTITPISPICYGGSFTLEAALGSSATPNSYTWQRLDSGSWTTVQNTASAILTVIQATATAEYRVLADFVSENGCPGTSAPLTVEVAGQFTPGAITTIEQNICTSGTPEEITSVTDADGGLGDNVYQWYENNSPIDGSNTANYTPPAHTATGIFLYTRKVTNASCGNVDVLSEGSYTLRVIDPPIVTVDDVNSCAGGIATLVATVVGESAATYNWQYHNGNDWVNVQDRVPYDASYEKAGQTLTISGITPGTYTYRVQMLTGLSGCGIPTDEAQLMISPVPVGGTVAVGATAPICATTSTSLVLTGAQGADIAWYEHNGDGNWALISGATATQIQVAPATGATWSYMAVVSNIGCSPASSTIGYLDVLSAGNGGQITLDGNPYLCVNQSRAMNLTDSEGDLQWQWSEDGINFTDISGATTTSYVSESTLEAGKTYSYRVRATTALCTNTPMYSNTVTLRVYEKSQGGSIVATNGASSITMCYDGTADLKVMNYIGEAFRWISQPVSGSAYTDLPGGNADTYTLSTLGQGTYNIRVIVDSGCTPDTSSAMQVVVRAPIEDITLAVYGSAATVVPDFCRGHELVLEVGNLVSASARWTGSIITGTTASTYDGSGKYWRVNTAAVSAPATYTYEVTYTEEFCASRTAGPITVDYLYAPDAGTLAPSFMEFCNADITPQTLTVSGTDVNTTITKWEYKNLKDNNIVGGWETYSPGLSSSMISLNSPTDPGTYVFRVAVVNNDPALGACTTTYSNEAIILKYNAPTIDEVDEGPFHHCEEATVEYTFTGSAGAIFKWEKRVNGSLDKSGTGDINESLIYTGNDGMPQTITYTVTPVIGVAKECPGSPKTITYVLWPEYDIELDEDNSITDLSCYGATDGRLVFTTSSSSPATFTLSRDEQPAGTDQIGTAATFTGLGEGTYTLTVNNGVCIATKNNLVISGPEQALTITNTQITDALCYGGSSGVIDLEIEGGIAPYKASVNNGAYVDGEASFSFSGLAAGVYSVKVQDDRGCVTGDRITVGQNPRLMLTATAITPVSAMGAQDATATLQATGGSGNGYRYSTTGLDNDFSPNNVMSGLSEGVNYVYAKDQNGCMAFAPIQIGTYPDDGSTLTISLTASVTKPLTCDAASDAEITVQAFGSSNYQYSKDGMAFSASNLLRGFSAGVHTITVRDGASRVATIDVTVNPAISLSFTAIVTKQLSAAGAADAEVVLNPIGDPAALDYSKNGQWSSGSTSVFPGLAAGTYAFSVRYKNPASCESTPIVVGIPDFAPSTDTPHIGITASITRALACRDNTNAEITVTASGGNGTYSFSRDGGASWTAASTATAYVFDGLSAGTYNLQVRSGTDTSNPVIQLVVIPAEAPPVVNSIAPTAATCGNNNGRIDITASGGVGALEYSISGVQWSYGNRIMNLSAGNYNVLVKDGRGCMSTAATVTVTATPPVTFEVTSLIPPSALTAADGQIAVTITGGQSPYDLQLDGVSTDYSGHTPSAVYTFTALETGRYTLTVTDSHGCVATKNMLLGAVDPDNVERISVTYTTVDPTCHSSANGQIIITARGGSGTYTYSLDDKTYVTSNTFAGLLTGTYVVHVQDNATPAQKVYVSNVVLKGEEALSFTAAVVQNLSSASASDAVILISAKGGTAPYQYNVNGSTTNGYVSGLSAGEYDIVVSDDKGCSVPGKIRITPPVPGETTPRPSVSASIINEPSCFGGDDGAIAVTASGGRPPYAYSVNQVDWTTNNTITGLMAGVYTIYVKELSLNRITDGPTIVLNNPARLQASVVVTAAITASGAADGAVRVIATGGMQPYQYSIDAQNTYQYGDTFTGLQAQLYTFHVKDGKGCATIADIKLAEPDKISVSAQVTKEISCYGYSDAEITVTASGGTQPYSYRWDGVQGWSNSATLTGVAANTHDVFVRDAAGATTSVTISVPQPKILEVTAWVTTLATGTYTNGAIAITAWGGAGNYTYEVDDTPRSVPAVSGLAAGNHKVKVTDGNGCTAETEIYLASVDVIVNKHVIHLQKGHTSETYTIRLASAPAGNVTVQITDAYNNDYVTITPSLVVFTPGNDWWREQEVGVTIAPGVGSPVGGITYLTTKLENRVISAPNDADYMGITREVIVNIMDDGRLNCGEFESNIPVIGLNGDYVNSPLALCTSDNQSYVLTTTINGAGYKYRWLKENFLEVSTTASHILAESGTYRVIVRNANGCEAVSSPLVVSMEALPEVPVILGDRLTREGRETIYSVKEAKRDIDYRWIIPSGYSLSVGSFDTDPSIKMKIGATSSILRVLATRSGNTACTGVEGRLDIEVKASYDVGVYPTLISSNVPLKIVPKNMVIHSIAIISSVGESYPYRILSGKLSLYSPEEMQILLNGLPTGHYFIVFYGQEQNQDGSNGGSVVHTEHIVVKN